MEPIAIIGIGCRFPGAENPGAFWQLLSEGGDAVSEVPSSRWDVNRYYDPEPGKTGKMSTRWGGFLEQVDGFDAAFFGISPREVERMDPQQRLVLEVTWEAIEDAGIAPDSLSGSQSGVFIGIGNYDYCRLLAKDNGQISAYDGTGNTLSIAANRLSYTLDLRGPSVIVETACSSSLVATHFACRSLQSGESNLCLVGGVSLMLSPEPFITYSHARMMAADGRCKTFDASADGYVRGEGCGMVVLKRLSDAIRDGDRIQSVIQGTAINQDGLTNGLTAPNGPSQQVVIRQALKNAGVSPDQISYIEAHGTGTPLGDPIEFRALKSVLMPDRSPDNTCWLGSVKTNIGHLEAAAGIAGIIKVALSLQHKEIPPHLHLKALNDYISLAETSFEIPTQKQPWTTAGNRMAGVSAFGFGGTNCHVVLAEAHPDFEKLPSGLEASASASEPANGSAHDVARSLHLLPLSAKDEGALKALATAYQRALSNQSSVDLADVCFTAGVGRSHFDYRLAITASSTEQLQQHLNSFLKGEDSGNWTKGTVTTRKRPKVAFLFTGQGSQYIDMGRELYETQPVFRTALDRCDQVLQSSYLQQSLLSVLYSEKAEGFEEIDLLINQTAYTQPALFALEYALAQLWKSWGVEPSVVIGHSVGEYAAACVAGVFSLEDGLKLMIARARLMQALPLNGKMAVVFAQQRQVEVAIEPYAGKVAIAAINGPNNIVISGEILAVEAAMSALNEAGVETRPLKVSHAFHSALMEPMLAEFEQIASTISYATPSVPLISNLTGQKISDEIAAPAYWCRHIREPVQFERGIETLHQQGYKLLLEIGPKPVLLGMARYCLPAGSEQQNVFLIPSLRAKQGNWQTMLQSLAAFYTHGVAIDWVGFDQSYVRQPVPLPTYPFQRQRYWVDIPEPDSLEKSLLLAVDSSEVKQLAQQLVADHDLSADEAELLPKLLNLLAQGKSKNSASEADTSQEIGDWFYEVEWQLKPYLRTTKGESEPGSWLIFADSEGFGYVLAEQMRSQGHTCGLVYAGDRFQQEQPDVWTIDPACNEDCDRLLKEVTKILDQPFKGIIHLWNTDAAPTNQLTLPELSQAQTVGLASVLHLLQALIHSSALSKPSPKLWLVTQGAHGIEQSPPAVAQSSIWGLGRVIALEHKALWGGLVDLSAATDKADIAREVTALFNEVQFPNGEDQLALRGQQRYVARLVRSPKVVRSQEEFHPSAAVVPIKSEGTYLITGGMGALGLQVARWLTGQGARSLVLTGRRKASDLVRKEITQLEQSGCAITPMQADVACEADVDRVIETIAATLPPLCGVIHAAGVLDDGTLQQQTWQRFARVMAAKVQGTWNLHCATQGQPLDFFVMFSSAAALLGSLGQGNYAAANAFMDGLAHYRRGVGLPALSLNWGAWGELGMAAELVSSNRDRLSAQGIGLIASEEGVRSLEWALTHNLTQLAVLPFDWSVFKRQWPSDQAPSFLSNVLPAAGDANEITADPLTSELLKRLQEADTLSRQALLLTYMQSKAAQVLGLGETEVEGERSLYELGLDSLMAIELTALIRSELQIELPVSALMEDPSLNNLVAVLTEQIAPETSGTATKESSGLDLGLEAALDESIYPGYTKAATGEPVAVLLTGGTGFLGAFLLQALLDKTRADVFCLVRSSDLNAAALRLQDNLKTYGLWQATYAPRIIPVLGDLAQPKLGISETQYDQLAEQIDTIYHNGALLNYVYPYAKFKAVNVLGTQEVLRLACTKMVKRVHHVSSVAVLESSAYYNQLVTEETPIDRSEDIYLGYSQSKWVSEKLVQIAGERGLPVTIYRPPLVSGHSQTGVWNTSGFLCRMIKGCIQMGSIMADLDLLLDLSPVDYNAQSIVYLSQQQSSTGKTFHLQNPRLLHWRDLIEFMGGSGYPIQKVSYENWIQQLSGSPDNSLYPLLPFFRHQWPNQLTYIELNEKGYRPLIACDATLAALSESGIVCPPLDAGLLSTYFSYFVGSGFLAAPEAIATR